MCSAVDSKDSTGAFHFGCLWTESPCVEGMVWGTSQGAWLDSALAALMSPIGRLWSPTASGVPSHHIQEVTQDEKKPRSPRTGQNSALPDCSFWIVSRFLLCNVACSCFDSWNEQMCWRFGLRGLIQGHTTFTHSLRIYWDCVVHTIYINSKSSLASSDPLFFPPSPVSSHTSSLPPGGISACSWAILILKCGCYFWVCIMGNTMCM